MKAVDIYRKLHVLLGISFPMSMFAAFSRSVYLKRFLSVFC